MNISRFIREKKEAFRKHQMRRAEQDIGERDKELKRLREERVVFERRAELERAEQDEKARIEKAKGPSLAQKFSKGLASVVNKSEGKSRSLPGKKEGNKTSKRIGLLGEINRGSSGLDFGGRSPQSSRFSSTLGSPFSQQQRVKPKQKPRRTIIYIR